MIIIQTKTYIIYFHKYLKLDRELNDLLFNIPFNLSLKSFISKMSRKWIKNDNPFYLKKMYKRDSIEGDILYSDLSKDAKLLLLLLDNYDYKVNNLKDEYPFTGFIYTYFEAIKKIKERNITKEKYSSICMTKYIENEEQEKKIKELCSKYKFEYDEIIL